MTKSSKLIAGAILVLALAILAATPQVPGAIFTRWFGYQAVVGYTQWAFVGTTTAKLSCGQIGGTGGLVGIRDFNDACLAEFPMSRTCSTTEFIESVQHYPFSSEESAWIRADFKPLATGANSFHALDASGMRADPDRMQCRGFYGGGLGITVNSHGSFSMESAGIERPVACCALIQVPEPAESSGLTMGILALGMLVRRRSQ